MKTILKKIAYGLCIVLVIVSLAACGAKGNRKDENKKPSESEKIENVTPESETSNDEVSENETQEDDVSNEAASEKPSESEKPSNSEKPNNSEKPSDIQKPSDTQKPDDTQIPSDTQKPSDTQTPSDTQKPSEPEATLPSTVQGWSKVPNFKGSGLSEQQMAVKIVECIISSSMTDFEKALEIHDWLIFNVDYDQTYKNYHATNAFVDRSCVCQGYAESFELLAEAAGLEATFVAGSATNSSGQTESHAWNQVKISGKWYNVDVTWDDPTHAGKNPADHSGNRYDYFLVSKAQIEKDHRADSYYEGEKSCPTNYDRATVLKAAANTGRYGDVAVVTNVSEANVAVKKFMDKNKTSMNLWIYDTSVNVANASAYVQNIVASLQYPINISTFYPSDNGIIKCPIGIRTSTEWNAIPVVTNVDEFKALLDKNGDAGITNYTVRYESSNGQPALDVSKYGWDVSYITYNNGNSWLINVIIL